jgi:hypothetical protein
VATKADIEPRHCSLLQKAVRRGHVDLVYTISAFIESLGSKPKEWYRTRTVISTFEECWPLAAELNFNRKFHSKVAALILITRNQKIRDAGGLAYLAHALSQGDSAVYTGIPADRDIKIIANAIRRPDDFWQWVTARIDASRDNVLLENTMRFRHEGTPREQAALQSAAYLMLTGSRPQVPEVRPADENFPYWVVFDQSTPEGKLALRDVARSLNIQLPQLEWACNYYEGFKTNGSLPCSWWNRFCEWQFQKVGLKPEEAHLLWKPARSQVMSALASDGHRLQRDLYRWKLSNLKQIESLKRQVELFIEHSREVQRDQKKLFD